MTLRDALRLSEESLCRVGTCLPNYSKEDIETLEEWIANKVSIRKMIVALRSEYPEFSFSENTFFYHLRAECQCPEKTTLRGFIL